VLLKFAVTDLAAWNSDQVARPRFAEETAGWDVVASQFTLFTAIDALSEIHVFNNNKGSRAYRDARGD
jgi:hypothetical protein